MVDIKNIQKQIKNKDTVDKISYNLYLRSIGKPASSQFGWTNPVEADGEPVLARQQAKNGNPNVKVRSGIVKSILSTKTSYGFANIQRQYNDDIDDTIKDLYQEYDRLTCIDTFYSRLSKNDALAGSAYSLTFLVGEGVDRQPMSRFYPSWNGYVKYDDMTGESLYGCIYGTVGKKDNRTNYGERDVHFIELYDKTDMYRFECNSKDGNFKQVDSKPHGFTEVPVIEWRNNDETIGNVEEAVTSIDAYQAIISDGASEIATLANAYLVIQNGGDVDPEKKEELRQTGIFTVGENGKMEFVTKDINPEFIDLLKEELRKLAYESAQSLDPRVLQSQTEMRKAQVDNMYSSLDMACRETELEWRQSLEYLDRVLKSFWTGLAIPSVADYSTYDINYIFTKNKPQDIMTDLKDFKDAGGQLPQYKLIMKAFKLDEAEARSLAEEANAELTEALPSFE